MRIITGKEGNGKELNISEVEPSPGAISDCSLSANIHELFGHWQSIMNHPHAKLDKKRQTTIQKALQLGYNVVELKQAAEPTEEYIRAIHTWYEDKLWLFDLVSTAKSKRLLEVFLYARQRYNIDVFVMDSFMKLDIAEDDYKAQKALMEQLYDFKNQHGCHIHIVVHSRKGADESHPPGKLDNKGTGAISDLADNCFTIWRNKYKEELLQCQASGVVLKPKELEYLNGADCKWCCDKQRNG